MNPNIFSGTVPALMTPCTAARKPDFDKLVEKAKELVGLGMSAVVYCGSMGDWPLLTTEERMEGVEREGKGNVVDDWMLGLWIDLRGTGILIAYDMARKLDGS